MHGAPAGSIFKFMFYIFYIYTIIHIGRFFHRLLWRILFKWFRTISILIFDTSFKV